MEFAWDKFEVGASVSNIRRLLKACDWSKKKNRRVAREGDPEVRDACLYEPSECKSFQLIFVDESECDRLASVRRTGWAARGMPARPDRGTHDGERSPWELDLRKDARLKALYLDNESIDGYRRDQDVFGPGVTTEDNLAVIVDYERGATLSYALNAHSPWEGYRIAVNGDQGRAELDVVERTAVLVDADGNVVLDPSAQPESTMRAGGQHLRPLLTVTPRRARGRPGTARR